MIRKRLPIFFQWHDLKTSSDIRFKLRIKIKDSPAKKDRKIQKQSECIILFLTPNIKSDSSNLAQTEKEKLIKYKANKY